MQYLFSILFSKHIKRFFYYFFQRITFMSNCVMQSLLLILC